MLTKGNGQSTQQKAETLYERYGKPLEEQYKGQYVAISEDGKIRIGASLLELIQQAKAALGPGNFVFKIGERSVGKWL